MSLDCSKSSRRHQSLMEIHAVYQNRQNPHNKELWGSVVQLQVDWMSTQNLAKTWWEWLNNLLIHPVQWVCTHIVSLYIDDVAPIYFIESSWSRSENYFVTSVTKLCGIQHMKTTSYIQQWTHPWQVRKASLFKGTTTMLFIKVFVISLFIVDNLSEGEQRFFVKYKFITK